MSLIAAAAVFAANLLNGSVAMPVAQPASAPANEVAAKQAATDWLTLIDNGRWEQSWRTAGSFFRAKVTAAQWAAMGQPIRTPLGAVKTRVLQSTSRMASLPGVPDGDYAILVFQTDFAQRIKSIETVTLVREGGAWKVVGYFIR